MIFIIRALPQSGKDDGDYDSPTSRGETPDEKYKNIKKGGQKKRKKEEEKAQKMREKERRGNATILLPHLCLKVAP